MAASIVWDERSEAAFLEALQHSGGLEGAKPKAILQLLAPQFPELTLLSVNWHLKAHRRRQKRHAQMETVGIAPPTKWTGRLESAFQGAVQSLGGARDAKPLLVWQQLVPSFPEVTLQVVRQHLKQHRMKSQSGDGFAEREREPMQLDQPTEGELEADTDVLQQQQPAQQQQQQKSQLGSADDLEGGLRPPLDPEVCFQVLLHALEHKLGAVMRQKTSIGEAVAQLEAQELNARGTVFLLLRGAGGERLADANSSGASSGNAGSYTSTESGSLLQRRPTRAAYSSGGRAGAAATIESVAAPPDLAAAARREVTDSWQQRTREAFARALPVSGDAAQCCNLELPLPAARGDPLTEHPAGCTVPGCKQCQYKRWQRMQLVQTTEVL